MYSSESKYKYITAIMLGWTVPDRLMTFQRLPWIWKQIHTNECNLDLSLPAGLQSAESKEREYNHSRRGSESLRRAWTWKYHQGPTESSIRTRRHIVIRATCEMCHPPGVGFHIKAQWGFLCAFFFLLDHTSIEPIVLQAHQWIFIPTHHLICRVYVCQAAWYVGGCDSIKPVKAMLIGVKPAWDVD